MLSQKLKKTLALTEAALTQAERRGPLGAGLSRLAAGLLADSGKQACLRCTRADFFIWPGETGCELELGHCAGWMNIHKDESGRMFLPAHFFCTALALDETESNQ